MLVNTHQRDILGQQPGQVLKSLLAHKKRLVSRASPPSVLFQWVKHRRQAKRGQQIQAGLPMQVCAHFVNFIPTGQRMRADGDGGGR